MPGSAVLCPEFEHLLDTVLHEVIWIKSASLAKGGGGGGGMGVVLKVAESWS